MGASLLETETLLE